MGDETDRDKGKKKAAKDGGCPDGAEGEKVLLDPEEWRDDPECRVISEYHSEEGKAIAVDDEDPDLADWLELWSSRSSQKVLSEYHKEGAPFLDEGFTEPTTPKERKERKEKAEVGKEAGAGKDADERIPEDVAEERPRRPPLVQRQAIEEEGDGTTAPKRSKPERVIDISTIEFLAWTIIRALFPRRVKYHIEREGVIDMDVIIQDRDIILSSNQLSFEIPEMSIWRIILAYKERPIIEIGRGVKNRFHIYRWRFVKLLFAVWWQKRKEEKERRKKERERAKKAKRRAKMRARERTREKRG